ncbi:o-succinylbenzoate synthase [Maribacter sp. 2307ULW6-5]|uniref:o-succinylbenzoate synthase n=1 Tax=Maribacter sp. 2307ULW6-5 TaxID=3386275 RepID=UPI0039BC6420
MAVMTASFRKYTLNFKRPGGTSRGVLTTKDTYFLHLSDGKKIGLGECGLFRGLSCDDHDNYEEMGAWVANNIDLGEEKLLEQLLQWPSLFFGVEQAFRSLRAPHPFQLFDSPFIAQAAPIAINGLIWMGDLGFMQEQLQEKVAQGFACIKLKIGALDFEKEVKLLQGIRAKFTPSQLELRVDANGAFAPHAAMDKLTRLSELSLHSIEQPIKPGQWAQMQQLCAQTPLPIALDEELIGVTKKQDKKRLLERIGPQYIILKPSLVGGYRGGQEWIDLARDKEVGWWVTSALESNVGLNAIAQWTATLDNAMPQGLGTGALFTNNLESPLTVRDGGLFYHKEKDWNFRQIQEICT